MTTLNNGILTVRIDNHGAELCSLKRGDREYLWGAYPEFWKRHSPVLFPIVGSVWNGEYRSKGKTYEMGQHGLARDMDFTPVSSSGDEAWFELHSTEDTLLKYPYPFVLRIGYRLKENTLEVYWEVENPSDEEMYFQIGAHPAFYWPMLSTEAIKSGLDAMKEELAKDKKRGYFKFEVDKPLKLLSFFPEDFEFISSDVIGKKGCIDDSCGRYQQICDNMLGVTTEFFDQDAFIIDKPKIKAVTLCDMEEKEYLTLRSNTPLVGLWSPPKKNAPFVCIEPWYGRADDMNYKGDFEEKPYMNRLEPKAVFKANYEITIH